MSKLNRISDVHDNHQSNTTFDVFLNGLNNIYEKYGDSNEGLHKVDLFTKDFFRKFKNTSYYMNNLSTFITDANECEHYHAYRLIDNSRMKLSIHIMPKGTSIPIHSHPQQFCFILMEQGTINLQQQSLRKHLLQMDVPQNKLLSKVDISVGMPINNNMHAIKAMSEIVVYISMRINAESNFNYGLFSKLFSTTEHRLQHIKEKL